MFWNIDGKFCCRFLFSVILLALFVVGMLTVGSCKSRGQCSGGNCGGGAPSFRFPVWRPIAKKAMPQAKKPMPKRPPRVDAPQGANFGLDVDKQLQRNVGRKAGKARYHLNGKEVDKGAAYQALIEADIPADASKRRLTIIGSKEQQDKVLADLNTPLLAALKNDLVIQTYTPDTPMMQGLGFPLTGSPSIVCQAPAGMACWVNEEQPNGDVKLTKKTAKGGEVLFRNKDGTYPGAEKLAAALRRTDPTYDPNKDSDVTPPAPKGPSLPDLPFDPASVPPAAYGLGAIAAFLLLKGNGAKQ